MRHHTVDPDRAALWVTGPDAESFLQGLVTNDVRKAAPDAAVYAAMLTPQGKYLADFFVARPESERFLIDVAADLADGLAKRLTMYKLRAAVEIARDPDLSVVVAWSEDEGEDGGEDGADGGADASHAIERGSVATFPDPREAGLGRRVWAVRSGAAVDDDALIAYRKRLISNRIPQSGLDLAPNESFPLELDFVRLNGVDFTKGCYVGQEVTARMRHKAELKKGLYAVTLPSDVAVSAGAEILLGDRVAGRLGAHLQGRGLALLRIDRAEPTGLRLADADDAAVGLID